MKPCLAVTLPVRVDGGAPRKNTQYETYYPDRKLLPGGGGPIVSKKTFDVLSESPSTLITSLGIWRRFLFHILLGDAFF